MLWPPFAEKIENDSQKVASWGAGHLLKVSTDVKVRSGKGFK
jgi:hypothetical protein